MNNIYNLTGNKNNNILIGNKNNYNFILTGKIIYDIINTRGEKK